MIEGEEEATQGCAGAPSGHSVNIRHTYDALIRTWNSLETARETVSSLRSQSLPPLNIIIVDSGSEPSQKAGLVALADKFIDVSDRPFNYSYSINIALPEVSGSHVLIISSHTRLLDDRVVQEFMQVMDDPSCAAAYLDEVPGAKWQQTKVTLSNFDSMNGLSNRCALIPMARLRDRPFREDVFACEDQVWAKAAFGDGVSYTMAITTERFHSTVPTRGLLTKWANEQVALAYYVDSRRMSGRGILWRVTTGVVFALLLKWDYARIRFWVAYRLIKARRKRPSYESGYL